MQSKQGKIKKECASLFFYTQINIIYVYKFAKKLVSVCFCRVINKYTVYIITTYSSFSRLNYQITKNIYNRVYQI